MELFVEFKDALSQIPFVLAIMIMVVVLIRWISKRDASFQEVIKTRDDTWQTQVEKQEAARDIREKAWRDFLADTNKQNLTLYAEYHRQNLQAMGVVTAGLGKMSEELWDLAQLLEKHDGNLNKAIAEEDST